MTFQLNFTFEELYPILSPDDIYSSISPEVIERLKEDRRIERKPAGTQARELGTYFSMWANTPPEGGLLLLGVEDDGIISGCNRLTNAELNNRDQSGLDILSGCSLGEQATPSQKFEGRARLCRRGEGVLPGRKGGRGREQ